MTPLWEDSHEPESVMLSLWVSQGDRVKLMAAAMMKDTSVFELIQEYVQEGLHREGDTRALAVPAEPCSTVSSLRASIAIAKDAA